MGAFSCAYLPHKQEDGLRANAPLARRSTQLNETPMTNDNSRRTALIGLGALQWALRRLRLVRHARLCRRGRSARRPQPAAGALRCGRPLGLAKNGFRERLRLQQVRVRSFRDPNSDGGCGHRVTATAYLWCRAPGGIHSARRCGRTDLFDSAEHEALGQGLRSVSDSGLQPIADCMLGKMR